MPPDRPEDPDQNGTWRALLATRTHAMLTRAEDVAAGYDDPGEHGLHVPTDIARRLDSLIVAGAIVEAIDRLTAVVEREATR